MAARNPEVPARSRTPVATRQRNSRGTARGPAPAAPRARLTARGAVLALTATSFLAVVAAGMSGNPLASEIAFPAACALAVLLVRDGDLLPLAASPPLAFGVATLAAHTVLNLNSDSVASGVAVGVTTTLAATAPALFLGTALVLVVALVRGMPGEVRELNDAFHGRRPRARRGG
ncbi:hypothetical protein FHX37_2851 [Haloactinospora alba]|uniref:DUF6542 domain-containing protein n=1 Tax=Haloactinospora alba TaxID=405555 RepID=A0A543NM00_9ACTN|nr:DUF6542 domain-containing protein [Haloactinospora alba]TQN32865.1 hypothetical protein FHX37_2851 [Haloactinospora alba]